MKIFMLALIISTSVSCSFQKSSWEEQGMKYSQINITPPFGRQAESAGQMSATTLDDGTWELVIGRTDKGVDNTAQSELIDLVIQAAIRAAATGGMK